MQQVHKGPKKKTQCYGGGGDFFPSGVTSVYVILELDFEE